MAHEDPLGQQRAVLEESRDIQDEPEEQQKLLGNLESTAAHDTGFEDGQLLCRRSRMLRTCLDVNGESTAGTALLSPVSRRVTGNVFRIQCNIAFVGIQEDGGGQNRNEKIKG